MADRIPSTLLFYDGVWNDVSADVDQETPIVITEGGSVVSDAPKASEASWTFLDNPGTYRPHLATSPLYGKVGRNTPVMMGDLAVTDDFENAVRPMTVTNTFGIPWVRTNTSPHSGSWCFSSGVTPSSGTSDAAFFPPAGVNLVTFWYRTDSSATDVLSVTGPDGATWLTVGGTGGVWKQASVPINPRNDGGSTYVWFQYVKDAAAVAGADAVYIDDMVFYRSRLYGEVSSWGPDQTVDFVVGPPARGKRWTEVTAAGVLRRVGTWTDAIQSAMTRTISAMPDLAGAWPLEDESSTTVLTNLVSTTQPVVIGNVNFGSSLSPGGGSTSAGMTANSVLASRFVRKPPGAWQFAFAFRLPAVPGSVTSQELISWQTSVDYRWSVEVNNGSYTIKCIAPDGTSLLASSITFGAGAEPNKWIVMRLRAFQSGGNVDYNLGWYPEGGSTSYSAGSTFVGTVGYLRSWAAYGSSYIDGGAMAYVYGVANSTTNVYSGPIKQVFNGYVGELAGLRLLRLASAQGLVMTLLGDPFKTEPMGAQRPGRVIDQFRECRDTDGGMIFDAPNQLAVMYRTRLNLYTRPVTVALTFGTDVAPPLKPILDDLYTANYIVVSQLRGGETVGSDDTGPMGTQPAPVGAGLNKRTIEVNLGDQSRADQLGHWYLNLGTNPEPRYATVVVDCELAPSLETGAGSLLAGDRITITGLDPDVINLMVIGVQDVQTTRYRRRFTYSCQPASQFSQVAKYDNAAYRYDSASTTLGVARDAVQTAWTFTTADSGDLWARPGLVSPGGTVATTTYDVFCEGERLTVTAMGAAAGTGPYTQAATVTRGVNGVPKAHPVGAPIRIATPGRWAL